MKARGVRMNFNVPTYRVLRKQNGYVAADATRSASGKENRSETEMTCDLPRQFRAVRSHREKFKDLFARDGGILVVCVQLKQSQFAFGIQQGQSSVADGDRFTNRQYQFSVGIHQDYLLVTVACLSLQGILATGRDYSSDPLGWQITQQQK